MTPTVDRLHRSIGMGATPPVGNTGSLISSNQLADIRQRLMPSYSEADNLRLTDMEDIVTEESVNSEDPEDILGIDEEMDIDEELDLTELAKSMEKVVDPKADVPEAAPIQSEPLEEPEEEEDEEDDEDDEDDSTSGGTISKKILIIGAIAIGIIVLIIILVSSGNSQAPATSTASTASETSNPTASNIAKFANDQLTPTDPVVYQDSMIIDKYFIIEQDSCTYIFEGYAENARAFVKAYVDLPTYNQYRVGARVPITYERITLSGKDYYMKVRII